MSKEKHVKLGETAFIKGGNNTPSWEVKHKIKDHKVKIYKAGEPEFVRDDYEQGVIEKNKGASNISLVVTHGKEYKCQ